MENIKKSPDDDRGFLAATNDELREFDYREALRILLWGKWTILGSVSVVLAYCVFHLLTTDRVYSAEALVEVGDESSAFGDVYSDLANVRGSGSASSQTAEIAKLKSRKLLVEVVRDLNLSVQQSPIYAPGIGKAASRVFPGTIFEALNRPGDSKGARGWLQGFYWGGSRLDIRRMHVSPESASASLVLRLETGGLYTVSAGESGPIATGSVGETITFGLPDGVGEVVLNVRGFSGTPGVRFSVRHVPVHVATRQLQGQLNVSKLGRSSGVLRLSMNGTDPRAIVAILDAVSEEFIRKNIERKSEQAARSLEFLDEQFPLIKASLEDAENKLAEFQQLNRALDMSAETESLLTQSVQIEQQIASLELKRKELLRSYTNDHPLLITLEEQMAGLQSRKSQLDSELRALPDKQQEILQLNRQVEVSTGIYTFLLNKTQELRIAKAGTVGNVQIIDSAIASYGPIRPNSRNVLLAGLMLGTFLGVGIVFLRRMFLTGVVDPEEVERTLAVPVYAMLPWDESGGGEGRSHERPTVLSTSHNIAVTESFRSLRTNIHFSLQKSGKGAALAISGPTTGVGKTFVTSNLAYTLASTGARVLFVDTDMRRGDASYALGVEQRPGLSNLLTGADPAACIQQSKWLDNLFVIARGKAPPNPAELLMGDALGNFITGWKNEFDFVLLDTAPVLAVTDPIIVSALADALYIVGRAGQTPMHEMAESVRRFQQGSTKVAGVILNGLTSKMIKSGAYGRSYSYRYYDYQYATSGD